VLRPIPDTSIFDLRLARRGQRLNRLCASPMTTGMGLITFEEDQPKAR
jgi:hypothetical protein